MRIAATGLAGNIGQYLPKTVISLETRLESGVSEMQKELASHPGIDCLIHLAALSLVKDCEENPDLAFDLNVNGSLKWFEAASRAGIKHFIFASTSHVYGNPKTNEAIPTTCRIAPINVYGRTKAQAEKELLQLTHKFPATQLTIARMFSLISKNSNPGMLYPNLHRRAREKDFSSVPGLNYVRDFLPMETAAQKLLNLAKWKEAPQIVNICSGHGRSILDLAEEVFQEYGISAKEHLKPSPPQANDIPWIVGKPTEIPN